MGPMQLVGAGSLPDPAEAREMPRGGGASEREEIAVGAIVMQKGGEKSKQRKGGVMCITPPAMSHKVLSFGLDILIRSFGLV